MPFFWDTITRSSSTYYRAHDINDMIFATIIEFFIACMIGYGIRNGPNGNKTEYKFVISIAFGLFLWMQAATWIHLGR